MNKVNSRVTLHFDLSRSQRLTKEQKGQITKAMGTRINKDGVLKLHAQAIEVKPRIELTCLYGSPPLLSTPFIPEQSENARRSLRLPVSSG